MQNMTLPGQLDAEFERELRGEMAKYGQLVNVLIHQVFPIILKTISLC